jgi:DNA-binding LacI/PurR family transcriptional regulator
MSLEQVARRAKVSTATVSRVLNDTGAVKGSTRVRVLKAVAELNYHPNLHARSLAGGKSRTLGVIVFPRYLQDRRERRACQRL